MNDTGGRSSFLTMIVGIAAAVLILAGIFWASKVISQFLMAFVIAVAVAPIQKWLMRRGWKPVWAFLVTVAGLILAIGILMLLLTASLNQFIQSLPQYKAQFADLQKQVTSLLGQLGISKSSVEASASTNTAKIAQGVAKVAAWLASAFANFGFMLALAAFMLVESIALPGKVRQVTDPTRRVHVDRFIDDVRSYIVVTAWVNFLVGAVDTVLLLIMGVPYAVLWGVLAFLFGFIPSVGFLLSLVGPALMALLTGGPTEAVIVIVAFIVINGGIQNVLLPRQMGEGTDLSPAVVFGSLLFWGFILGPVGAILSVPMTMIVRLALEYSESTRGLSYLMSTGKHPYNPALGDVGTEPMPPGHEAASS